MTIEIKSAYIAEGVVFITAVDVSEEHLQYMERNRDDGLEKEIQFVFDTRVSPEFQALHRWLHKQKATKQSRTYGEALAAIIGTITESYGIGSFRAWD